MKLNRPLRFVLHSLKRMRQALNGITLSWESELTMRVHIVAVVLVSLTGVWVGLSATEWAIVFSLYGLIMGLELVNSCIEALCDFVQPHDHPAMKRTKDLAAGAVLMASVFAVAAAIVLFYPKISALLAP
jgi:diacylglycerol kinase